MMVFYCLLQGFEFRVILLLNWLPTKASEPSLHCYLIHSWGREEMNSAQGYLCKNGHDDLSKNEFGTMILLSALIATS